MRRQPDPQDRSVAFERLFRDEYQAVADYIARRADRHLVDDLVDEVFIVVWRRLERVPREPRPWLLAVARNVLGTHIRGARRNQALSLRLAVNYVEQTVPPASGEQSEVIDALWALRPKDREALMLVNWEGLSPAEAALVLGERPASFRMRLHRAKARFGSALRKAGEDIDGESVKAEAASA